MGEAESYMKYQDAKSDVLSGLEGMLKYGQELDLDMLSIADDIRDQIAEVSDKLLEEI